jgi:transposase
MAAHIETGTMAPPLQYQSYTLDHLGVVAGMCDELGIAELIDRVIVQDRDKRTVSVGTGVKAMILNGLGFVNRALYLTPHFFEGKPLARLLGPGIQAEYLNDDVLGRHLDELYEYGVTPLYSLLAAQAVQRLGLGCRFGHLDTTSFHTDGQYHSETEPDAGVVRITRGYSRDHRPDLNQVVLQLLVERQAGIPLLMEPLNGNNSDNVSFRDTIKAHIGQLQTEVGVEYVGADSALYTAETLPQMQSFFWFSRVPETLSLARALIHTVAPAWRQTPDIAAQCSLCVTYAGVKQRWLIVWSPPAYQRALGTVRKQSLKQSHAHLKAFEQLCRQDFTCETDARNALAAVEKTLTLTTVVDSQIVAVPRYRRVGRPAQDRPPDAITYRIDGALASLPEQYRRKLQQKSCFILATNQLDSEALSDDDLLSAYKDQQKVERGFRFLKDPLFMASTLYLKSPKRIMALMMVMTLCLLVYAALEYRLRQALQQHDQTFPNQKGQPTRTPTARWVLQCFTGIHLLVIAQEQVLVLNLSEPQRRLLAVLGERYVALYSNSG